MLVSDLAVDVVRAASFQPPVKKEAHFREPYEATLVLCSGHYSCQYEWNYVGEILLLPK